MTGMETKSLWIVPSRGRPENVERLINHFRVTKCEADLMICVDTDDPRADEYSALAAHYSLDSSWLYFRFGERLRLGGTLNKHALLEAGDYAYIGFMGDDHRPASFLWDAIMVKNLRDMGNVGFVYGDDLFQGVNLPTAVCMTSNIIRTLGYMVPPTMTHLYLDNFWLELGRACGCIKYLDHVIIEHVHPAAGKAEMDERYSEVNSNEQNSADLRAFNEYKSRKFGEDIAKVNALKFGDGDV